MAEMKNICGKIPQELHAKVRQEIEEREISTQQFIQQVIEEHFAGKGEVSMAVRTLAVQISEELFTKFKAVVAKKGCKQKDFLIALIERAIAEAEAEERNAGLEEQQAGTASPEALEGEDANPEPDAGPEEPDGGMEPGADEKPVLMDREDGQEEEPIE